MTSTFSGLYISLRAMQAQQLALETSAHNIANSETEGFSRQRAVMAPTPPWPYPSLNSSTAVGQVGTGVEITNVERLRDQYLDVQLRKESGALGEWSIKQDALEQVEVIFQEPTENGLNSLLTQFWDSWQELSMKPENTGSAVRTTVIETAASLADAMRNAMQQLDALSKDIDNIIEIKVIDINSIASQISHLNNQIKVVKTAGLEPNDLMDKRDLLLDELASMIDFRTIDNGDGTIDVNLFNESTGDYSSRLVDGAEGHINSLETAEEGGSLVVQWADYSSVNPAAGNPLAVNPVAGENLEISSAAGRKEILSGELRGLFDARDNLLAEYQNDINVFAANLIEEVNAIHETGYGLDGSTGLQFFSGTGAADISINAVVETDIMKLAASSTAAGIPGDGSNALAISNLRDASNVCESSSFNDYYRNIVSRLGVDTNESKRMSENQEALFGQLKQRKESISGVSIDEEMAHMVEFQHSYEAAARFLSTVDSLLDTLINRTAV